MPEFHIGDYVEIQAGSMYAFWKGKRGYVSEIGRDYVTVQVVSLPPNIHSSQTTSWYAHHLVLVDSHAEAIALLGEDYFA